MNLPIDTKSIITTVVAACIMLVITGLYNLDSRVKANENHLAAMVKYIDKVDQMNETLIQVDTTVKIVRSDVERINHKLTN